MNVTIQGVVDNTVNNTMDNTVTAQELKTKGTQAIKAKTSKYREAFISVRGEKKFVVLTIEEYGYLRECELEAALKQSQTDLKARKFSVKRVENHIKDLENV